jgi:hypothetical protein
MTEVNPANKFEYLLNIVRQATLSQERDRLCWKWKKNGNFTVKSMYNHLCRNAMDRSFRHIWKSKIPLKIQIWLWLIWHNAIVIKDNLFKRKWLGSASCQFCHENETISHFFFDCVAAQIVWSSVATAIGASDRPGSFTQFFWWFPRLIPASRNVQIAGLAAICWAIWKLRNRACFEHKLIKNPSELISFAAVFMNYWAGLHSLMQRISGLELPACFSLPQVHLLPPLHRQKSNLEESFVSPILQWKILLMIRWKLMNDLPPYPVLTLHWKILMSMLRSLAGF